jgi:hypothetical protein
MYETATIATLPEAMGSGQHIRVSTCRERLTQQ